MTSLALNNWPQNAWWMLTKENLIWRTSGGKLLPRWPEEMLEGYPKTSLKHFNILPESWEEQHGASSSEKEQMIMRQRVLPSIFIRTFLHKMQQGV